MRFGAPRESEEFAGAAAAADDGLGGLCALLVYPLSCQVGARPGRAGADPGRAVKDRVVLAVHVEETRSGPDSRPQRAAAAAVRRRWGGNCGAGKPGLAWAELCVGSAGHGQAHWFDDELCVLAPAAAHDQDVTDMNAA